MAYPEDRSGDTTRMMVADDVTVEKRDVVTLVGDQTVAPVEPGDDPLGVVVENPENAPGIAGNSTQVALTGRRNAKVTDDASPRDRLIGAGNGELGPVLQGENPVSPGFMCLRPAKSDGLGLVLLR